MQGRITALLLAKEPNMRAILSSAGLLAVLIIGHFIYSSQMQPAADGRPATEQIKLTGIRGDLRALAQAERLYFATNGSYATLEQLRQSSVMNALPGEARPGYRYALETDGTAHFRITAIPTGPSATNLPTLSIDESMQITQ
jgi:hypothetical protein